MGVRHWLRPPRHVLVIFALVGIVSATVLAWLMASLLKAEETAEAQRYRERLQLAADRAVATMQSALSDLEFQISKPYEEITNLPQSVFIVRVLRDGIVTQPGQGALYYVHPIRGVEAPLVRFEEIEQTEWRDPTAAADMYSQLANDWDAAVRGGALMRLARVRRRINNPQAAVRAYDELSEITGVSVSGLPAGLVARVGRASVYEEMGRTPELRSEAESLDRDLRAGRWQLTIQEYESYSGLTKTWLRGTLQAPEPDSLTRTDAAAWLWENRRNLVSRQWINVSGKALLIVPRATSDGFVAAIAETDYLTSLCREQIGTDPVQCTFSDAEGRILAGPALQTGMETRTAASTRLPWTLHLSGDSGYPAAASRKPGLLGMVFVLTLVWLAGAAFIVHGIGREVRMARLQSDFVAAVSHEFRSPLTSIGQIAEMLSSDRLSSQESRSQAYTVLSRESDRLRRLVEGLLDFQKIESDSPIYHFELVEIGPFLKTVVSDFRQRVADRGYTVELGETHGAPVVRADRDALSLATWNLLDNAMKYSPDCKTVWVDVEHSGKTVIVVVRDRGLGIPLKEQRAIFERFVRGADAKARRIRGTGIGLALVRRIVQAHGGEIRLWSQPGEGSRFAMIFPAGVES